MLQLVACYINYVLYPPFFTVLDSNCGIFRCFVVRLTFLWTCVFAVEVSCLCPQVCVGSQRNASEDD